MRYLSSRAASESMLRRTLERRAQRRLDVRALDGEAKTLIEATVSELVKLGLLNDAKFAEVRAASLMRKGFSKKRIVLGLRQKGIVGEKTEAAIDPELDELVQARRFAERKRLGAWRRGGATPETRNKDLRTLARAGFGYAIAAKALSEPHQESD